MPVSNQPAFVNPDSPPLDPTPPGTASLATVSAARLSAHAIRNRVPWVRLMAVMVALCAIARVWAADSLKPIDYGEGDDAQDPLLKLPAAERAARRACTLCHLFVEPDMLTKTNWATQILPRMQVRLGVAKPDFASSPEGEIIRARKVYTERPLIPVEDWPLIEEYYLTHAPDKPLPQDPKPPIGIGLKRFKTEPPRLRFDPPSTTLVKISPATRRIYVGDDKSQRLAMLDGVTGEPIAVTHLANVPTDLVERENGFYVTCVGSFIPSEIWRAEFLFVGKEGDGFGDTKRILQNLPRSTMARFADFNGDGREDFALCMFGNLTGRFSWFERRSDGGFTEHVLTDHTGATSVAVHDFNDDGKPDLAVLFSQDLEMLVIMINDGKGNFTGHNIFQQPPVFGHSYLELTDFNRDGRMDLLVCNGDNGEYESPTKKYHGIRLWLNKGGLNFEQAWFYPMNGSYAAVARDFDEDGDMDVAAISFFPDYEAGPRESFIYLENDGKMNFTASTFRECISGRWIVMDAGDIDGDGDIDLVLGSYINVPFPAPKVLVDIWNQSGASVQILRNTLR